MEEVKCCKENKEILEFFKGNKEVIITAPAFIITVLGISYGIIRYYYSIKAEQFYGIPRFYFYDNLQADYIMNVVFFMATVMFFFSPLMIKRFLKKNKLKISESIWYSFLLAFFVLYLSLAFCVSFIMNTLHITGYDSVLLGVCIVVAIISWFVYFNVFKTNLTENPNIDEQKTKEDESKKDASTKPKTKKKIILIAFAIVTTTIICIIGVLMLNSPLFRPNNKKNYEIIQLGKLEYNVIVGYYKDSAIIMKGKIDYQNSNSNSHLKIEKGYYKLESIEEKDLVYCSFDLVTCED